MKLWRGALKPLPLHVNTVVSWQSINSISVVASEATTMTSARLVQELARSPILLSFPAFLFLWALGFALPYLPLPAPSRAMDRPLEASSSIKRAIEPSL